MRRPLQRSIWVLAVVLTGGVIAGSLFIEAARADDDIWVYTDTLMPDGHARTAAQRDQDERACGATPQLTVYKSDLHTFAPCMNEHGWRLDHIVYAKHPRHAGAAQRFR